MSTALNAEARTSTSFGSHYDLKAPSIEGSQRDFVSRVGGPSLDRKATGSKEVDDIEEEANENAGTVVKEDIFRRIVLRETREIGGMSERLITLYFLYQAMVVCRLILR